MAGFSSGVLTTTSSGRIVQKEKLRRPWRSSSVKASSRKGLAALELLLQAGQDLGVEEILGGHRLLRHLRQTLQAVFDDHQIREDQLILEFPVAVQDLGNIAPW